MNNKEEKKVVENLIKMVTEQNKNNITLENYQYTLQTFFSWFQVFVHCQMLVCKLNDTDSRCVQGCQPRSPFPVKRNAVDDKSSQMYSLAQGPLVIQHGPPSLRHRKSAPEAIHSTGNSQGV